MKPVDDDAAVSAIADAAAALVAARAPKPGDTGGPPAKTPKPRPARRAPAKRATTKQTAPAAVKDEGDAPSLDDGVESAA